MHKCYFCRKNPVKENESTTDTFTILAKMLNNFVLIEDVST